MHRLSFIQLKFLTVTVERIIVAIFSADNRIGSI